jgi:MarR family transcriptional regulator, lower aerobic nicotinate degradation pathway regulator
MPLERVAGLPTWLLSRANGRAQEILAGAFAAAGMRGYEYRLAAALAQYGPLSQADLGRHTGIDRKDVAIAVAALESRGLVVRDPDATDARRKVVSLAEAGARELSRLDTVLADVQEQVLAPLTRDERSTLVALLTKLTHAPAGPDGADTVPMVQ